MEGSVVLRPQDDAGWIRLLRQSPEATPFHLPAWSQVISATYAFPALALLRREGDRAVAGLPVMEVPLPMGRRRLVALPYTDHCAPLALEGAGLGPDLVRLHGLQIRADLELPGSGRQLIGTRHVLRLEPDAGAVFSRLHKNRVQRRVRRSQELGVTVAIGSSANDVETFYSLHCQTRKRQGVPVQPKRFLQNIWRLLIEPGLGFVVTARVGEKPIATALYLAWNRHLIYKFGASDPAHWNLGANFLVHWTAMEWGCRQGFVDYDFGRTDAGQDGLRSFKALWGAREIPLVYTHVGRPAPGSGHGVATWAMASVIRHSPAVVCRALGEVLYRYAA